jgi:hypothetical protein
MRRISKRQIRFNFSEGDKISVPIDNIESGYCGARLGNIRCRLEVSLEERQDLNTRFPLKTRIKSIARAGVDSCPPKNFATKDIWRRSRGSAQKEAPVTLISENHHLRDRTELFKAFAIRHPVGSRVEAKVLWAINSSIRLRLAKGVTACIPTGVYGDRMFNRNRTDLTFFKAPSTLEVIIRYIYPEKCQVMVTAHPFEQDSQYCNFEAAYRSNYDAKKGLFIEDSTYHYRDRRQLRKSRKRKKGEMTFEEIMDDIEFYTP